jgi:hypothetical protein
MARQPQTLGDFPLVADRVPFAEGTPPDDLQIEQLENDEVLIGDPDLDLVPEIDTEFDSNLAEELPDTQLSSLATRLVSYYESDRSARSQWEQRYKDGLKTLDPEGGMQEGMTAAQLVA